MEMTVALAVAASVVTAHLGVRFWMWRPVMKRRVMVQTDADVAFSGVVMSRRGPLLVLADVTVVTDAGSSKADGKVVIDRARVLWMQQVN
jgi:hypothetical protein